MSHYALAKIEISPERQLFERVLEEVAQELGARLVKDAVVVGWDFKRRVDYLIKKRLLYGNGYGIELTDSGFLVHVDEDGAPYTARELAEMIAKRYMARALTEALAEMGFNVQTEELILRDEHIIVVTGEKTSDESWGDSSW